MRIFDFSTASVAEPREALPDDPRVRQVLRSLRQWPQSRALLGKAEPAGPGAYEQTTWLYWILRMTQPDRVLVYGTPSTNDLITLSAAVADGRGRRVLCLGENGRWSRSGAQALIAAAGLDWILRFNDRLETGGFVPDALVIAGHDFDAKGRALEALELFPGLNVVIGMDQFSEASEESGADLKHRLEQHGFRLLLPEAAPAGLWAAFAGSGRA